MTGVICPSYRAGFASPQRNRGMLKYPHLWRGCVGAWAPCLGATGLRLYDQSGRGNHGTLTNMDVASDWVVSGRGTSLDLDGANDSVIMSSNGFNSAVDLTVSVWLNIRGDTTGNRIVEKGGNNEWTISLNDNTVSPGTIWFVPRNRDILADGISASYNTGVWDHYSFVLRSADSAVLMLRNGIQVASKVQAGIIAANDVTSTYIGQYGGGGYNGNFQFDDLRIYTNALSYAEISTLALRRGIAYETVRNRKYKASGGGGGGTRKRYFLLMGCGS